MKTFFVNLWCRIGHRGWDYLQMTVINNAGRRDFFKCHKCGREWNKGA